MNTRGRNAAEVIDGASRAFRRREADRSREADRPPVPSAAGIDDFERWLKVSVFSPPRRMIIPAEMELGGTARLAEMVEVVRAALLACMSGLEDCNARTRLHWCQVEVSSST